MSSIAPTQLDLLLDYLKVSRGFDFTGYKRTTLERRMTKRMEALGLADYVDYRDHLETNPREFEALFDTILINVTGFFRDSPVWEHLAATTIPALLAELGPDAPIRVWCAGCSTGEETYTIAMLLTEALGLEEYVARVKIYATDVDEDALAVARAAVYSDKAIETLPPGFLERYFKPQDRRHALLKELRRTVIFGRNDLLQDAPISRIDLLSCRNTLMYFNAETQGRVLNRFSFALNGWGTLLLGKSEMLITHSDLFVPQDLKRRLFSKARRVESPGASPQRAPAESAGRARGSHILELAFDASPTAELVVDEKQRIAAANGQARALFGLGHGDVGRPLRDLELSYRPIDLRTNLELATSERRSVTLGHVVHTTRTGEQITLDVHVAPVVSGDQVAGATVVFADVTVQQQLRSELETSKAELENAYEELQSTVEELETTNEELQSTNEELETTNEELQSTNEELETTNEELQSTNAELETMNDELRSRTGQLNDVNGFLETILTTLETAVVVVDGQLIVQMWNGHAEELFGLRLSDVQDRALLGLDIGLPLGELADPLRDVLRGTAEREVIEVEAVNRRGRAFASRVTILPLEAEAESTYGALLLIAEVGPDGMPPAQRDDAVPG